MTAPENTTPGDWIADEKRLTIGTADHALDIAMVFDDGSCPAAQIKADLYLLAASKRLYLAAKEALKWHEAALRGRTSGSNAFDIEESLRAALREAEGR